MRIFRLRGLCRVRRGSSICRGRFRMSVRLLIGPCLRGGSSRLWRGPRKSCRSLRLARAPSCRQAPDACVRSLQSRGRDHRCRFSVFSVLGLLSRSAGADCRHWYRGGCNRRAAFRRSGRRFWLRGPFHRGHRHRSCLPSRGCCRPAYRQAQSGGPLQMERAVRGARARRLRRRSSADRTSRR